MAALRLERWCAEGPPATLSGGGSGFVAGAPEQIRLIGGSSIGTGDARTFLLIAGDVTDDVADVVVTVDDRPPLHAQIGTFGPAPRGRWFATADLGDPRSVTTAVALDVAGREIGRRHSPS